MQKSELRAEIRRRRAAYGDGRMERVSECIAETLLAHPVVAAAKTVLAYHSLPGEVCTHTLVGRLAAMGKTVLLPSVQAPGEMVFKPYAGDEALSKGAFGIYEPDSGIADCAAADVAIVPGVAFDKAGNRLGRGGGYYDRALAGLPVYKIGVCFPFQLLDRVPSEAHDVRMDEVVSAPADA